MGMFGGLIAGGLAGAGAAAENVTGELIKTQSAMDLERLRGDIMAKREMQITKYRYDLENQDRRSIGADVSKYAQPREETLAPDQQGPVGTITPSDSDVSRRGSMAAMRAGRPDIAGQYRAAGEPGRLEVLSKEQEYASDRERRAAEAAIDLKKTPGGKTQEEVDLLRAQAGTTRQHGNYYEDLPRREQRIADREEDRNVRETGRIKITSGERLQDNAKDAEKAFNEKWMGVKPDSLKGEERAQYFFDKRRIAGMQQQAQALIVEGNEMLKARPRTSGARGGTEEQVLLRDPVRSEDAPIEGAYLADNGFWYGPDKLPVTTRSGRPVRKSLSEKNDSNMTDAVDRDDSGNRVEGQLSAAQRGLISGEVSKKGQFNRAEQELIDDQTSQSGKMRVRNEIMRQRQIDARRAGELRDEEESRAGFADYARRGIDPRTGVGMK